MNHILYQLILNKTSQLMTVAASLLIVLQPTAISAQDRSPDPTRRPFPSLEDFERNNRRPTPTSTPTKKTVPSSAPARNLPPAIPAERAPSEASAESNYTLGGGDQIRLDIFQVDEYSGDYPVLVDGTISLPLVGNVKVSGLTLKEASGVVSKKYSTYLKRPLVTVGLIAPRPLKIGISGEVDNPGSYEIPLDPANPSFPSVTDMIERAGGVTTIADVRSVRVTRMVQGREVAYSSNLWTLLTQGRLSQDISLRDGDTIFIPTVDELNTDELARLAEASFGIQVDEPIKVAVVGEINRPGSHTIVPERLANGGNNGGNNGLNVQQDSFPPRLSQAIEQAQGIKPLANVKEIEIRRRTWDGQQKVLAVDLWELIKSADIGKDVILQEGDRIIIPKADSIATGLTEFTTFQNEITVNVVGEVVNPGAQMVPPNTPLNQAILAAGGFDSARAKKGSVQLVRLKPDGTVDKRKINVDFSKGIDDENNPTLRNQDVVVVSRSGFTSVTDTVSPVGGALGIFRFLLGF